MHKIVVGWVLQWWKCRMLHAFLVEQVRFEAKLAWTCSKNAVGSEFQSFEPCA